MVGPSPELLWTVVIAAFVGLLVIIGWFVREWARRVQSRPEEIRAEVTADLKDVETALDKEKEELRLFIREVVQQFRAEVKEGDTGVRDNVAGQLVNIRREVADIKKAVDDHNTSALFSTGKIREENASMAKSMEGLMKEVLTVKGLALSAKARGDHALELLQKHMQDVDAHGHGLVR